MRPKLDLKNFETYRDSTIKQLKWQLNQFFDDHSELGCEHLKDYIADLNAYENLDALEPITQAHVKILEDEQNVELAEKAILNGEIFWEHAAAGEATRLGLGTKYLLNLKDLSSEKIAELISKEAGKEVSKEEVLKEAGCESSDLLDINLGTRHMIQLAYDIAKLAKKHDKNLDTVLGRQKMLVIMNEKTGDQIVAEWKNYNYMGFNPDNIFFMVQKSFEGIDKKGAEVKYDISHDKHKRLHNHGQMAMQKTHEKEIFRADGTRLSSAEFENILSEMKDLISYNIEDIKYLTGAIDYQSMSLALELGAKGYGMVMEIVAQNPKRPQKGGAAFYDKKKDRVVMIESNQLKGIKPKDITHLNKNFNHYPNPVISYRAVREGDMHLHTCVKSVVIDGKEKHYLYFCTPQGDINFLVKTAYVMRRVLKPIEAWKSAVNTPATVAACHAQDKQEGFKEFCEEKIGVKFV